MAHDPKLLCGIADSLPATLTSVRPDGTILFVNGAAAKNLSGTRETIIGRSLYEFFPERVAATRERIRQAVERRETQRFEAVVTLPDGRERMFESAYCPAIDEDGMVVSIQIFAQDVTEERRAAHARREGREMWGRVTDDLSMTTERLAAILENAPMTITVHDPDMTVRHMNRVIPGVDINDVIGSSPRLWITEESADALQDAFARVIATQSVVEVQTQGKSGRKWLARLAPLIHDGQVKQILTCTVDITERSRLEAQLWQRQKVESLGTMAGGIAHDFNNLLSAIMGNVGLARRWLATSRDPSSFLANIDAAARKAAELCQQMLAYAGQERPALAAGNLNARIEEMTRLTRAAVSAKIRTQYELAENLPNIRCNEAQLGQIVLNLVNNSADAIGDEHGSITISTEVIELCEPEIGYLPGPPQPGRYVRLRVTDTGKGMAPESLSLIFDPYYSTKSTGHGLGLSAVLGIVSSHDAAISVSSQIGVGTTMTVLFRVLEDPGQLSDAPASEPDWMRGDGTILLVDDEADVRLTSAIALEEAGYHVVEAADGDQALAVLASSTSPIRAIVLDMTMPGRDGYATLTELRKTHSRVPVLLSSGRRIENRAALDDPFVLLLPKPYTAAALTRAVLEAIRVGTKPRS